MEAELTILLWGAASIAFIHTLLGPDHYLPFVAMGKARGWGLKRIAGVTLICGLGHSLGSILLGLAGVFAGAAISKLAIIEGVRGDLAAWGLIAFGLVYMAWGLKKAFRNQTHSHWHRHEDGTEHEHSHDHHSSHMHVHEQTVKADNNTAHKPVWTMASWSIFIIFVLGPCEPLIPLMMAPAVNGDFWAVMMTVGVFTGVTVATMLTVAMIAAKGLKNISFEGLGKYAHALAGGTISLCGIGIVGFGL